MPAHKIEIVFITIVNRVAVTTRRVLRLGIELRLDEVKPGITGPPACSCDRIGIPGWAPITEALALARVGCCSGGN